MLVDSLVYFVTFKKKKRRGRKGLVVKKVKIEIILF